MKMKRNDRAKWFVRAVWAFGYLCGIGLLLLGNTAAAQSGMRAWGHNGDGQLGDGTSIERHTPVAVNGLTGVTAISAGAHHNLALKSDGTVWAWGFSIYGQ